MPANIGYHIRTAAAAYQASWDFGGTSTAIGMMVAFLPDIPPVWVDVPDFEEVDIDFSRYPGGTARVICALSSEDTGSPLPRLMARLYDITNTASLGQSAEVSGTTPTDATFSVTSSGIKHCRLQMTADVVEIDLFCAPGARVDV